VKAVLVAALVLLWPLPVATQSPAPFESPTMKRVLILHQELPSRPFRARFNAAFVEAMRADAALPLDIYEEALESDRLSSAEDTRLITDYLRNKFADRQIDVIVVVGVRALTFARQHRAMFGSPAIVAVVSPLDYFNNADAYVTGLQGGLWAEGTVDLALALRPDTRHVFVVDGTHNNNGELQAEIERQFKHRRDLELVYLRDLALTELLTRIANIPPQSVVLFVRQTMRSASQGLDPFDSLSQVVRTSPVPVFTQLEEFMGHGVVGGHLWRFEDDARRIAAMTKAIVNGARARDIAPGKTSYAPVVDWRQLQRWQIPASRVPAGGVVLFREQSFWQQYTSYIVGGFFIFAAQLGLIVGLLVQRVRRRRAEEEAWNSEARYRSVVDTQSELICRFLPDATLTFVNDAYCRFWNRPRNELLGRKFTELIPATAREAVLERIARIDWGVDSHEHSVTLADGTVGWQQWINHAIVDDHGRLVEIQGVGRDLTERQRARQVIDQLASRNDAILRAIPDLMFVLKRDGTYVDYHARDPALLFLPPDQFIGKRVRDIMPPALADLMMRGIDRACLGEEPVVLEYELTTPEPRCFEARLVAAEPDRVLSIVRDVTDSKRTQARNRDLAGRLISSQEAERSRIAQDLHDGVCQDLAAITVDLSYLRQRVGQIQTHEMQDALVSVQRRSEDLAEGIRLLSHGLHPSVLHHIGLVAALQAHCAEVERQHHMQVTFSAEGDIEPANQQVGLPLFRIAQEALRNTVRHGHASHACISLVQDDAYLTLTVSDDGAGFDPAAARQNSGLGLLSIEERARLLKGHATLRSRSGHGTTIGVQIPVEIVDQTEATTSHDHSKRSVSIVDTPAESPLHDHTR
jgi:PAS domain S-box-containing protein